VRDIVATSRRADEAIPPPPSVLRSCAADGYRQDRGPPCTWRRICSIHDFCLLLPSYFRPQARRGRSRLGGSGGAVPLSFVSYISRVTCRPSQDGESEFRLLPGRRDTPPATTATTAATVKGSDRWPGGSPPAPRERYSRAIPPASCACSLLLPEQLLSPGPAPSWTRRGRPALLLRGRASAACARNAGRAGNWTALWRPRAWQVLYGAELLPRATLGVRRRRGASAAKSSPHPSCGLVARLRPSLSLASDGTVAGRPSSQGARGPRYVSQRHGLIHVPQAEVRTHRLAESSFSARALRSRSETAPQAQGRPYRLLSATTSAPPSTSCDLCWASSPPAASAPGCRACLHRSRRGTASVTYPIGAIRRRPGPRRSPRSRRTYRDRGVACMKTCAGLTSARSRDTSSKPRSAASVWHCMRAGSRRRRRTAPRVWSRVTSV